jgi:carbon storage regulator CsrA
MLVLTQRAGDSLEIGNVSVLLLGLTGSKAKIGIMAPAEVSISRNGRSALGSDDTRAALTNETRLEECKRLAEMAIRARRRYRAAEEALMLSVGLTDESAPAVIDYVESLVDGRMTPEETLDALEFMAVRSWQV